MSFLTFVSDLSNLTNELRESRLVLLRIAEAMERLSPPLPASDHVSNAASTSPSDPADGCYMSESPEEYQARTDEDKALALSFGMAPWSPLAVDAIRKYREELMKPEVDSNGQETRRTAEEANAIIREGFETAGQTGQTEQTEDR